MRKLSLVQASILSNSKPIQCPTTSVFDLEILLRAATLREDAEEDIDGSPLNDPDVEAKPGGKVCHDGGSTTLSMLPQHFGSAFENCGERSVDCVLLDDHTTTHRRALSLEDRQGSSTLDREINLKRVHEDCPTNQHPTKRRRNYGHWIRARRRDDEIRQQGHVPRTKIKETLLPIALNNAKTCPMDYMDLPATNGAYSAKISKTNGSNRVYTLEEVKDLGMTVYPWDGIQPVPFVDADGRVFLVLAGRPVDKPGCHKRYTESCDDAYALLEQETNAATFAPENTTHRCGEFPVINVGVTHGMGTVRPTSLDVRPHEEMVGHLLNSPDFQRIASFGSASFALWSPDTYRYYKNHLDPMYEQTGLPRIFPRSVFPAAAFNCGPKVCTKKHTDGQNCPFGSCSVTSLRRYNPKTAGHLVLWELGMAIEFPPGSTVLLPSATISHSNTPILDGEVRASFTQYASGGLFRWVDYGFQTEKSLKKQDPALYQQILQQRPDRWREGVNLFSTITDLKSGNA